MEIAEWKTLHEQNFKYLSYTVAHDWSVKPSGQEMVIDPLHGDNFLTAVTELCDGLHRHECKLNQTCGLHVHVNASDLSYWEMRRVLRMYATLEGEIYNHLILPYRRTVPTVTHYCQMLTVPHTECARCVRFDQQYPNARTPSPNIWKVLSRMDAAKTTSELKRELLGMLYCLTLYDAQRNLQRTHLTRQAMNIQTHKGGRYEWCRYVGLNLHAWLHRGTIEWRMKEATMDPEELTCWALWCGWFIEACSRMKEIDSHRSWNLLTFTQKYMPGFLATWVEEKMSRPSSVVMPPGPPERDEMRRPTIGQGIETTVDRWVNQARDTIARMEDPGRVETAPPPPPPTPRHRRATLARRLAEPAPPDVE